VSKRKIWMRMRVLSRRDSPEIQRALRMIQAPFERRKKFDQIFGKV
jgi:hypothetical protein